MQYSLHDVFISYRRYEDEDKDKEKRNNQGTRLAQAIYNYLTGKGLRVFWDDPEMEPGDFAEQLHWQIEHSPNYIFIGTEEAKRFRAGKEDYVAEELKTALRFYRESLNKDDRVVTHVLPWLSKEEREKAEAAGPYPDEIQELTKLHGVEMQGEQLTDKNLSDILKLVTRVNRGNMWNAGYRWYEQSRKPGARFANLSIDRTIMPNADDQAREATRLPIYAHGEQEEAQPLLKKIENTPGHLYLIGEGGIGKTTALYSIMESVYGAEVPTGSVEKLRMNGQVPVFVELSRAPDTYGKLYEGGRSTFIHRAIYQQIRQDKRVKQVPGSAVRQLDEVFTIDPETAVNPIHDLFTEDSPAPEYLLLLDGLNEVSRAVIEHKDEPEMKACVVTMILQEIHQLMTECPNVRVILTSRTKEQTNWGDETTLLYLSGVGDDSIKAYLTDAGASPARIEAALNNDKLRQVLRVPLFLTLYAGLTGEDELLTQGEILHLFFHQKKEKLYSAKNRIDNVEDDVDKAAFAKQYHRLTATMQSFILDFILPEVAWRMEQGEMFHIYRDGDADEANLADIIEHVLTDESDTAVCGRYSDAFSDYLSDSDAGQDTLSVAKDMVERLGGRMRRVVDNILNCAVMTLGILQKNGDEYGFIHHHIRDYFAAVYQINRLKLAAYLQKRKKNELARECLADWKEAPLHTEVRRFIGEALGEAHNAPVCDDEGNWHYAVPEEPCERNLIKRGFDIYRERFYGEDGYAVWNLLEVLKKARGNLSGEDFSRLDLTCCDINGYPLGVHGISAVLEEAKLNEDFMLPKGHTAPIKEAVYCPKGKQIVTTSYDNSTAKVWDSETLQEIGTLKGQTYGIKKAVYSLDGKYIVTILTGGTAIVWDSRSLQMVGTLKGKKARRKQQTFIWNERLCILMPNSDGTCNLLDSETHQEIHTFDARIACIEAVAFSLDGRRLISGFEDGTALVWDTENLNVIESLCLPETVQWEPKCDWSAALDWRRLVVYDQEKERTTVWEIAPFREIGVLGVKNIRFATFSQDGRFIITIQWIKNGGKTVDYVIVWDAIAFREIGRLDGYVCPDSDNLFESNCYEIVSVVHRLDQKRILTVYKDGTTIAWDAVTFQEIGRIEAYGGKHSASATFSPDGRRMIIIYDGSDYATVWDMDEFYEIGKLKLQSAICSVAYSPNGQRIITTSKDDNAIVWDSVTLQEIGELKSNKRIKRFAAYHPNGNRMIITSWNGTAKVWDVECMRLVGKLQESRNKAICTTSYSPNGEYIVAALKEGLVQVWDAETYKKLGVFNGTHSWVPAASYSPDGQHIVTVSGQDVKIWDAVSFNEIGRFGEMLYGIKFAVYSPNGRYIITAPTWWDDFDPDKIARIWDAGSMKEIGKLVGHTGYVRYASYRMDGQQIVTASSDSTAKIWDSKSFQEIGTLRGHDSSVNSAVFNPDGQRIVTASSDGTARIWDAMSFQEIGRLKGDGSRVFSAFYSPDGRNIVTVSNSADILIWNAYTLECRHVIHDIFGLDVTGVDLRHLHPDSHLSAEVKERLYEYGAIVDERG